MLTLLKAKIHHPEDETDQQNNTVEVTPAQLQKLQEVMQEMKKQMTERFSQLDTSVRELSTARGRKRRFSD
jgi:hypothetical protein